MCHHNGPLQSIPAFQLLSFILVCAFSYKLLQSTHFNSYLLTFHNTCENLCGAIKQVRKCPLFRLILSFYPLDMAFKVCPSLPIIVHWNTLFRVTFGYSGSIKNLLGSSNFLEPFQKVQQRIPFLKLLKRFWKTKPKRFLLKKMVLNHIYGTIFGSVFYFLELFFVLWGFS